MAILVKVCCERVEVKKKKRDGGVIALSWDISFLCFVAVFNSCRLYFPFQEKLADGQFAQKAMICKFTTLLL